MSKKQRYAFVLNWVDEGCFGDTYRKLYLRLYPGEWLDESKRAARETNDKQARWHFERSRIALAESGQTSIFEPDRNSGCIVFSWQANTGTEPSEFYGGSFSVEYADSPRGIVPVASLLRRLQPILTVHRWGSDVADIVSDIVDGLGADPIRYFHSDNPYFGEHLLDSSFVGVGEYVHAASPAQPTADTEAA